MTDKTFSPAMARIVPFAVYMFFIAIESFVGAAPWVLPVQVAATALATFLLRRHFTELVHPTLRTRDVALAAVIGVVVWGLWLLLEHPALMLGDGRPVSTTRAMASTDPLAATVRLAGAVVLVPIIEELFWRSFLMRWLARADFAALPPASVPIRAILISSALFALEHHALAAGFVAGLVYGEMYRRTGSLTAVVIAHAITNAMLHLL